MFQIAVAPQCKLEVKLPEFESFYDQFRAQHIADHDALYMHRMGQGGRLPVLTRFLELQQEVVFIETRPLWVEWMLCESAVWRNDPGRFRDIVGELSAQVFDWDEYLGHIETSDEMDGPIDVVIARFLSGDTQVPTLVFGCPHGWEEVKDDYIGPLLVRTLIKMVKVGSRNARRDARLALAYQHVIIEHTIRSKALTSYRKASRTLTLFYNKYNGKH